MLQFHSLFSFITLILTLSFVGSAAADDDPRPHETETTTKTVALEVNPHVPIVCYKKEADDFKRH
jgi:hypothetical protein